MARIETRNAKDGARSWRVSWRLGATATGKWQSITVLTSEADAQVVAAMAKAHRHMLTRAQILALVDPEPVVAGPTVAAWCSRHVASLSGIEGHTRQQYERMIAKWIEPTALGQMALAALTREHVRLWLRDLEAHLAPKTVANHQGVLSACIAEANDAGLISTNPCRGVRLPRRDDHTTLDEQVYLDPSEVRLIASRLPDWCGHIPTLLADTGLRWSELTALQVGDVDVLGGTLQVARAWKRQAGGNWKVGPPKSQRSRRIVAVGDDGLDVLIGLTAGRGKTEWVVTSVDGRSHLPRSTFMRHWTAALYGKGGTLRQPRPGGLITDGVLEKRPHIHSLRHTHASWMISHGASPAEVQAQLGHEDIGTTMSIYAHLMPNARDNVRESLRRAKARPSARSADGTLGTVGQQVAGVSR